MTADIQNRIQKNSNIHLEKSVNEIVNEKSMSKIIHDLKNHQFEGVRELITRYKAKVANLGSNYLILLAEQLISYHLQT